MRNYILWLPSWYPNRLSAFDGDFIQRHAIAASRYHTVHVVHFVRDPEGTITKDVWVDERKTASLQETIVYYHSPQRRSWFLDRVFSWWRYNRVYRSFFASYFQRQGLPAIVHVHVAFKAGTIALYLKRRYALPYIMSEHWTIYLPEATPHFKDQPRPIRQRIDAIVRHAHMVLPVSANLQSAMQERWPQVRYQLLPNVVDPAVFHPADGKEKNNTLQIIHISTLNEQKNTIRMLEALALFEQRGCPWRMDVFGPADARIHSLCKELALEKRIIFHGEHPQSEVARVLRQRDVLLLFSNFENQPCVLLEAMASGVPVLVSDIPAHRLLVQDGVNGILVPPDDPHALADRLQDWAHGRFAFRTQEIVHASKRFHKENVELLFKELYDSLDQSELKRGVK